MSWTVIVEDENGHALKELKYELNFSNENILYHDSFKLLKYLNPYGDTTFNSFMLDDLSFDLKELLKQLPADKKEIEDLLDFIKECKSKGHLYLKFYGD